MKKSTLLLVLAASLLTLNMADLATTWFLISNGKGVEANPIILLLGGPFSPLELLMKVAVFPATVLGIAWWLAHKSKDPRLGIAAIIPATVMIGTAVANNVIVAAKKVKKIANQR